MLSLITPLRSLVVLFGLTVIATARQPRPVAKEWHFGEIERGSIERTDDGGTFVMHRRAGSRCANAKLTVHFHGTLPPTACDGMTVAVDGERISHHDFEALDVNGFHDGPYDNCWQLRCNADAYDRCRGSKFE